MRTTKVIYRLSNWLGDQYSFKNCAEYGTKWKVNLKLLDRGNYKVIGKPILLNSNWSIDRNKVLKSIDFVNTLEW